MDAVFLGYLTAHVGGDNGLDEGGVRRHGARLASGGDDVVEQQHTHLVAGDGAILPVLAADHGAHAVGVRVGADDEVAADLLGEVHGEVEALRVLRVGAHDRGEVAVYDHLLRLREQVLHAEAAQRLRHQLVARAVEGRVDYLELVGDLLHDGLVDGHAHDVGEEGLVRLRTDDLDKPACHGLVKAQALHVVEDVELAHLGGDGGGVLRRELGAV